jgi:hypothetical protein
LSGRLGFENVMKRHSGRQTGQAKRLPQRISGPPNWTWNSDSECRELFLP